VHAGGKHAHLHSDGNVQDIVPDLVEIGFDTLNLQVWCMNAEKLGRDFAGKICFRGELDRQYVLPKGTPEDVRDHVRHAREIFATPQGGYIYYGQVGPDVPLANIEAMLKTFYED
jgi:uroporphyrinogen-III decarboxylase